MPGAWDAFGAHRPERCQLKCFAWENRGRSSVTAFGQRSASVEGEAIAVYEKRLTYGNAAFVTEHCVVDPLVQQDENILQRIARCAEGILRQIVCGTVFSEDSGQFLYLEPQKCYRVVSIRLVPVLGLALAWARRQGVDECRYNGEK
jgi:hypothetical protein